MTGANRSMGPVSPRSGSRTMAVRTPASASSREPAHVVLDRARHRPGREPAGRLPSVGHKHGREVRDPHLGRVAAHVGAVAVEHAHLVAHGGGVAEQVAGVGVAGGEPQRAPLPRPAHQDRHVGLERARVADRLGHRDHPPRERGSARPPQQGQEPEGVLQEGEPPANRRELPAVGAVLPLEPGRPDAAHGPPAGQDVEGGDDLAKVGHVAVGHARHQRAQRGPAGVAGQEGEAAR
jgi:hypothetical protein